MLKNNRFARLLLALSLGVLVSMSMSPVAYALDNEPEPTKTTCTYAGKDYGEGSTVEMPGTDGNRIKKCVDGEWVDDGPASTSDAAASGSGNTIFIPPTWTAPIYTSPPQFQQQYWTEQTP